MDAGNFYSSTGSTNHFPLPPALPQYSYSQTDPSVGPSLFYGENVNTESGQILHATNFSLSQKIDLLVTSFEEHKSSLSKTVEELKTELLTLKSEVKNIKEGSDVWMSGKKRKRVPTDLSVSSV